jgi:hypothetical protein
VCGSEFTTKAATPQGDSAEFVPSLCVVGLGPVVARARVLVHKVLDRGDQGVARGGARRALRYLAVVPRPRPTAPRRYLIVVHRPLPAAPLVERRRYLIVEPRPMPAAPRRYFTVVPRSIPAAPHRYLIVVPDRCPRRRSLCAAGT